MAVPTPPTITTICDEALNKLGILSPSGTTRQTRAENEWMPEILSDIQITALERENTYLKTLQTTDVQISVIGQSVYNFPSDFEEEISIEVLDGSHTGTAQAGGNTSITLESGEDITSAEIVGEWILITGGTGVNGLRQCVAYNTTTLVATVDAAWTTNPDATSTYLIVDDFHKLDEEHILDWTDLNSKTNVGLPETFSKVHEDENVKMYFDVPTDKATYGIRVRYYADIDLIDLDSNIRVRIYRKWRSVLVQGIFAKALEDADDDRASRAYAAYNHQKIQLIRKEIPSGGEFEGFTK